MSDKETLASDEPVSQPEPGQDMADGALEPDYNVWMRGLVMVVFAILFAVAETVLLICAVLQFGWMLFMRERNTRIAEFGENLGRWLARVAAFQSGRTEDKPFPWDSWNG